MAYIILPHRWRRQPPTFVLPVNNRTILLDGQFARSQFGAASTNTMSRTVGPGGIGLTGDASKRTNLALRSETIGTGNFTVALYYSLDTTTDGVQCYNFAGNASNYFSFSHNYPSSGNKVILYGATTVYNTGLGISALTGLFSIVYSRRNGRLYTYINTDSSRLRSDIACAGSINAITTVGINSFDTSSGFGIANAIYYLAGYDPTRGWSDGEAEEFVTNPWSILQPLQRSIWVPSAASGTTVTPGAGALTLTGYAPTVTVQETVSPGVAALSITGYAPDVTVESGVEVTPGVGALSITGYAPTVTIQEVVTVAAASLTITGYAPSVAAATTVEPGVGALTIAGQAPTVTVQEAVSPGVASLTLTSYAPTVEISGQLDVTPGVAALTLTGYEPTVTVQETVSPGVAALSITSYAPSIQVTSDTAITPGAASLTLAGYAPSISIDTAVAPGAAQIIIAGYAPEVTGGETQAVADTVQPTGGWAHARRFRRLDELSRFPTPEEVQAERERLGILPKKAQKAVEKIAERELAAASSDDEALEAAIKEYASGALQQRAERALRNELASKRQPYRAEIPRVLQAILADGLRRAAEADVRQQQAASAAVQEEAEVNEILALFLEM